MHKGFTLIELLVVIAIIGILAAVGIPVYQGFQAKAKNYVAKTNFKSIELLLRTELMSCESGIPLKRRTWPSREIKIYTRCRLAVDQGVLQKHFIYSSFKNPYFSSSGEYKLFDEGVVKAGGGSSIGFIYVSQDEWAVPGAVRILKMTMTLPDGEVLRATITYDYYAGT